MTLSKEDSKELFLTDIAPISPNYVLQAPNQHNKCVHIIVFIGKLPDRDAGSSFGMTPSLLHESKVTGAIDRLVNGASNQYLESVSMFQSKGCLAGVKTISGMFDTTLGVSNLKHQLRAVFQEASGYINKGQCEENDRMTIEEMGNLILKKDSDIESHILRRMFSEQTPSTSTDSLSATSLYGYITAEPHLESPYHQPYEDNQQQHPLQLPAQQQQQQPPPPLQTQRLNDEELRNRRAIFFNKKFGQK